jgi:hypothetical protein
MAPSTSISEFKFGHILEIGPYLVLILAFGPPYLQPQTKASLEISAIEFHQNEFV